MPGDRNDLKPRWHLATGSYFDYVLVPQQIQLHPHHNRQLPTITDGSAGACPPTVLLISASAGSGGVSASVEWRVNTALIW